MEVFKNEDSTHEIRTEEGNDRTEEFKLDRVGKVKEEGINNIKDL